MGDDFLQTRQQTLAQCLHRRRFVQRLTVVQRKAQDAAADHAIETQPVFAFVSAACDVPTVFRGKAEQAGGTHSLVELSQVIEADGRFFYSFYECIVFSVVF